METINIIIMVWMEYNEMNKYLCKSTTKFRKYNKMNTNGVMMTVMMMEMMPKPPMIFVVVRIDVRMQVPPPDPFRRWGFCVFWWLRMSSLRSNCTGWNYLKRRLRWHMVRADGTGASPPVPGPVEAYVGWLWLGSSPRCVDNCLEEFNGLQLS